MPHPTPGVLGAFPGQWLPDELLEENPRGTARRDAPAAMGDGSFAGSRDAREVPKVRLAPPSPNDACFRVTARTRPTATLPARRHPERAPRRASCTPRGDRRAWLKSFPSAGRRHATKSGASQRSRSRRVFRRSSGTARFRRGASREDASTMLRGTRLASPPPPRRTPRASRASVAEPAANRLPSRPANRPHPSPGSVADRTRGRDRAKRDWSRAPRHPRKAPQSRFRKNSATDTRRSLVFFLFFSFFSIHSSTKKTSNAASPRYARVTHADLLPRRVLLRRRGERGLFRRRGGRSALGRASETSALAGPRRDGECAVISVARRLAAVGGPERPA